MRKFILNTNLVNIKQRKAYTKSIETPIPVKRLLRIGVINGMIDTNIKATIIPTTTLLYFEMSCFMAIQIF
jgi:hypothetical protein